MRVLVMNAGSSTLKWTLLDDRDRSTLGAGSAAWSSPRFERRSAQIGRVLDTIEGVDAIGHRVVLGGTQFRDTVIIDDSARAGLESLAALDRLHMMPALAGIDAATVRFPGVTQIAAFDTSFHANLPDAAAQYAIPFEWSERWGLRRFGFHGLSCDHALDRTKAFLGCTPAKMIVCHLGSGCSITASADGRSVDTTMGFTPLDGVTMSTRSGSVDPGLLLHLVEHCGVGIEDLREALETRSGLLGLSGLSGDLRAVLASDSPRARLAYEQFTWTLRRAVGAMAGVLGGVDALVFTGGIGENEPRVRADVSSALAFAGLRLTNDVPSTADRLLSASDSRVAVLLVHAREDLVVLREVLHRLHEARPPANNDSRAISAPDIRVDASRLPDKECSS